MNSLKPFRMAALVGCLAMCLVANAETKIVLIAGKQSHGPGDHEFRAGCLLLKKCLDARPGLTSVVYSNGWPQEPNAFDGADAVFIYADGGAGHPALQGNHAEILGDLVKKGVGLGCGHYAVEVPKDKGGQLFLNWLGGYYEHEFSVNPMWTPEFSTFPKHPITSGVKPFGVLDEWYFNLRFAHEQHQYDASVGGVAKSSAHRFTPILVAKPSDQVRKGPYVYPKGPYDHIVSNSGREEAMMWAYERPDRGRSFGFTGGHRHVNWGNDNFRTVVLNALLWIARVDVPPDGFASAVTADDLKQNLDPKVKK
jgi:hypothetical protein